MKQLVSAEGAAYASASFSSAASSSSSGVMALILFRVCVVIAHHHDRVRVNHKELIAADRRGKPIGDDFQRIIPLLRQDAGQRCRLVARLDHGIDEPTEPGRQM